MSGSFMQRGEPAFLDKWLRARLAVENGVDLVLELPAAFSLRSAEFFASGAVKILAATGVVEKLSCGAESPSTNFVELAKLVTSPDFNDKLQSFLGAGTTYAAAYEKALQALASDAKLNSPNDILALEYCKVLQDTNICPLFIKREQANYNDTTINGAIASATAIRKACVEKDLAAAQSAVPANVAQALAGNYGVNEELLWHLICYRLRLLTPAQIAEQCQCTEGLENLLKQAENCSSLEEAITMCSKKRYPRTRIRRLFMQLLLGKERSMLEQAEPAYIRVLAFNDVGRQLLKEMKESASLPIITKLGKYPANGQSAAFAQQLELELTASDVLALVQNNPANAGSDYVTSPYYLQR
jgi:predicted nucleotidyltransferase